MRRIVAIALALIGTVVGCATTYPMREYSHPEKDYYLYLRDDYDCMTLSRQASTRLTAMADFHAECMARRGYALDIQSAKRVENWYESFVFRGIYKHRSFYRPNGTSQQFAADKTECKYMASVATDSHADHWEMYVTCLKGRGWTLVVTGSEAGVWSDETAIPPDESVPAAQ